MMLLSQDEGGVYWLAAWAILTGGILAFRIWWIRHLTGKIRLSNGHLWLQKGQKPPRQFAIADLDIQVKVRDLVKNGTVVGKTCRLDLHGPQGHASIADSGSHLYFGLLDQLFKAKVDYLEQNPLAQLQGKGWVANRNGLQIGQRNQKSWSEIYPPMALDGRYLFHAFGDKTPILTIPQSQTNAALLYHLGSKIATESRQMEGLGFKILEKNPTSKLALFACLCGCFVFGMVTFALFQKEGFTPSIFTAAGVLICGFLFCLGISQKLQVFEFGIVKKSLLGRMELRFSDAIRFTISRINHYVNGVYSGTSTSVKIESEKGKPFKFNTKKATMESELDPVWDTVTEVIASKMLVELEQSERVPWTNGLSITPYGLEGFRAKHLPGFVPFNEMKVRQGEGEIKIHFRSPAKPLRILSSSPQFLPGLVVVQHLMQLQPSQEEQAP